MHKATTDHNRLHHSRDPAARYVPPLPAEFNSMLLSHYYPHTEEPGTLLSTADITPTGINIYCPQNPVANYQRLLCGELALHCARLGPLRPVAELHLVGAPLRQFSAEAITELTFRLGNKIEFTNPQNSVRGVTVCLADASRDNVALLAGLGYSCITLSVDATVASADRSLTRIAAAIAACTEFETFTFAMQLQFSDETDPEFLTRLVDLIATSGCERLELHYPGNKKPLASARLQRASDNFLHLYRNIRAHSWRVFGNHIFVPPQSVPTLSVVRSIQYTPWGLRPSHIKRWIGLGIAALGQEQDGYQRNMSSVSKYRQAILNQQLPVLTHLALPGTRYPLAAILQALACQHRAADLPPEAGPVVDSLVELGWAIRHQDEIFLTNLGILHLPAVTEKICSSFK